MFAVSMAINAAMEKKMRNSIELTANKMAFILKMQAPSMPLLRVNSQLSTAISRLAAITGSAPARYAEQNTASRRTGVEAIMPQLRELYRKPKTAIAARMPITKAETTLAPTLVFIAAATTVTADSLTP